VTGLRVFFIGGLMSYRALFYWLRPWLYLPVMLGGPFFQIIFFVYLGRVTRTRSAEYFVVGNAMQACAMAGIFGMTMVIANERHYGTLSSVLATPANRAALFFGRGLPLVLNGLVVSTFGFVVGRTVLDVTLPADRVPLVAAAVAVSTVSCTAGGLLLGSIGLVSRDIFFAANLVYFATLLLCGVNVPPGRLPSWMEVLGRFLPLRHGVAAARAAIAGEDPATVWRLIGIEAAVACAYAAAAFFGLRLFERSAQRHAMLERL
jgi:ABC-2 type transport system permease protein